MSLPKSVFPTMQNDRIQPAHGIAHPIILILAILLCLTAGMRTTTASASDSPKLLVLHSYHQGYPWTDTIQNGVSRTISKAFPKAELYVEYMNTKRQPSEAMSPHLRDLYQRAYAKVRFDIIIATDNNALDFLLRYRNAIFPGVPVVFCGINDIQNYRFPSDNNYTGIAENADIKGNIDLILKLHPNTKNLAVISDSTESGDINLANTRKAVKEYPSLKVIELSRLTMSQLSSRLKGLYDDTVVFNTSFIRDANGQVFTSPESMELIVKASRRPVYTGWDFALAPGVIGGKLLSGRLQGENAAKLAIRIIRGEKAGTIPIVNSPTAYIFDFNGLKKFGISESSLPPGSSILGKTETFYTRYRPYIWLGSGLFTAQILIISLLTWNIVHRRREETARQEAEKALWKSEARYHDIIENMQDTVYRTDKNGVINLINPSAIRLLGYDSADEILGHNINDGWMFPEKRQKMLEILDQDGIVQDYEVVLKKRDGTPVTVSTTSSYYHDLHGNVMGVEGIFRDITERKRAEEELFRQKNLISNIIESASEGIFAKDLHGVYISINKAGAHMMGYSVAEVIGRTDFDLLPIETAMEFQKTDQMIIDTGSAAEQEEIMPIEGTTHVYLTNKTPWRNNKGEIIGVIGVSNDISDRKEHEKEQLKIDKLESLGVLAGGIAHDFNNILTGIIGNISLAQIYLEPGHKSVQKLAEAEKASVRATELAHQLLTFAKGGEPVKKLIAIPDLIQETISLALHGSNCGCNLNLADQIQTIEADEGQLSQVFHNIIINATQAMPGGGTLSISAENAHLDQANAMNLPHGDYVKLSFSDQGCGISKENLAKIFDPYFTTKSAGNGLGLASARSIICRHGGQISASSTPDRGTTFTILLPSTGQSRTDLNNEPANRNNNVQGSGSILVMDDEVMILDMVSNMLEILGYEATAAENGTETIHLYRSAMEAGNRFSAVIMDLTIPGNMGGREAAERILSLDPQACLIVSSGYSNDPIMSDFRQYGFQGAVTKPYNVKQISQVLNTLIAT